MLFLCFATQETAMRESSESSAKNEENDARTKSNLHNHEDDDIVDAQKKSNAISIYVYI